MFYAFFDHGRQNCKLLSPCVLPFVLVSYTYGIGSADFIGVREKKERGEHCPHAFLHTIIHEKFQIHQNDYRPIFLRCFLGSLNSDNFLIIIEFCVTPNSFRGLYTTYSVDSETSSE